MSDTEVTLQEDPASFNPMTGKCDRLVSEWPPNVGDVLATDRGNWTVERVTPRAKGKHALTASQASDTFHSTAEVKAQADWPEGWGLANA